MGAYAKSSRPGRHAQLLLRDNARMRTAPLPRPGLTLVLDRRARSAVGWTWLGSRLLVAVAAIVVAPLYGRSVSERTFDVRALTHPFGDGGLAGATSSALSSLAHWDAIHYLDVAVNGYGRAAPGDVRAAFYPLYPMLVHVAAGFSSSPGVVLVAAYLVSAASFLGALWLLRELVGLELGSRPAMRTVLLLAVFPAAFYYSAPYPESLFLLVSVGAVYAARRGRWAWAGLLAAAASATRPQGLLVAIPIALMYLYGPRSDGVPSALAGHAKGLRERMRPRYPIRRSAAWIALAPAGIVLFSLYLWAKVGDPLAWRAVESGAYRYALLNPVTGLWRAATAAVSGAGHLLSGTPTVIHHFPDPWLAEARVVAFVVLALGWVAAVGAFRRLPLPYGAYAAASLFVPLVLQVPEEPLRGLTRYVCVVFPLFMWLAIVCERPRVRMPVLAASIAGLVLLTAQFAAWRWVA